MSTRRRSTSRATCPTDWQASSRKGTPAAEVTRPISSAGFTSPPFIGTCVMATSRTRSSSIVSSALTDSSPVSVSGTTSITAPVRSAT